MIIKYIKGKSCYKYLIMFDLASKLTGVCLWDLNKNIPVSTEQISVNINSELPAAELYHLIDQYFNKLYNHGIKKEELVVSYEAAPSQIRSGKGSTIQTFMALARSHAILDLYLYNNNIDVYDYVGIYPITTHAYFKKIMNLTKDDKVDKTSIKKYIIEQYHLSEVISFDESDAVFLAKTLVESKWNKDINEYIKEKKKHLKTLKASHAIDKINQEILTLELLIS